MPRTRRRHVVAATLADELAWQRRRTRNSRAPPAVESEPAATGACPPQQRQRAARASLAPARKALENESERPLRRWHSCCSPSRNMSGVYSTSERRLIIVGPPFTRVPPADRLTS